MSPSPKSHQLALERTLLAAERTLMAWLRTSLALIGFGFTIYTFLTGFVASEGPIGTNPRKAGLLLIGMGLGALVVAVVDYVRFTRRHGHRPRALPVGACVVLWMLGAVAFLDVLIH